MTVAFDRDQFLKDRREMLLALDVGKMREYAAKWGARVPASDGMCLWSMHMARLYDGEIPPEEQAASRDWLAFHDPSGGLRLP